MDFLKQYVKIINYALMGLVFAFAGFYLLSNAYHYLELRKDFIVDFNTQPLVVDFQSKMKTVNDNINSFSVNNYSGNISTSQMLIIQSNLKSCVDKFNNKTIQDMRDKKQITIIDVYNLRESYENDVLNGCIVNSLYWTTTLNSSNFNNTYMVNNTDMMKLYVGSLLNETSYLKKDLINNSSYFYNTSIASSSVKSNTKDGFYEVMGAYNKAASFVEFVSNWFKNEAVGSYE